MAKGNHSQGALPASAASPRRKQQQHPLFKLAPVAAAIMALSAPAGAATITWGGGVGDWASTLTPGGWAGGNVPDITDIAVINGGTVNLGEGTLATIAGLRQSNSSGLTGSGHLVTSTLNWLSGTQRGGGITTVNGEAILGATNSNNQSQRLGSNGESRILNLNGDTTFQSYALSLSNSTVNNLGTFTSKGDIVGSAVYDSHITWHDSSLYLNTFNNAGTFVQDASGKKTTVTVAFNNTGSVDVKSGALALSGGGTSTGSFATQAGQTLDFAGGTHSLTAGSLSNTGNLRVSGGTVNLDSNAVTYGGTGNLQAAGGTFNINGTGNLTASNVSQTGGTIGGSGSLITTVLNWVSGTQRGGGTTTVNGEAILGATNSNNQYQRLGSNGESRILNLNGDTTFQSYALSLSNSTVNNLGTFTSKGDIVGSAVYDSHITWHDSSLYLNTFNNAGTFIQDASGKKTTVGVTFNNTGSVNVKSGTLALSGGGTSTGSFTTQAGQTLDFAGGTHNITAGSLSNTGNLRISGGTVNLDSNAVTYGGTGNLQAAGGTFNINGTGNLTASDVSQTGGTIGGSGSLITTALNWLSGTQRGGGTTTVNGEAILGATNSNNQYQRLGSNGESRILNLNGDTTFQSYALSLSNSTVNNLGTFTSKGDIVGSAVYDSHITWHDSSLYLNTFNNAGTFIQDASGKKTTVGVAFNNTGSVVVKSGTLQLDNLSNYDRTTQALAGGSYRIENGNTLAISLGTSSNRIRTNSADITLDGANAKLLNSNGNSNALALASNTTQGSLSLLNGAALTTGAFANAGAVTVGNGSSFASTGDYVQFAGATVVHGALSAGLVDIQGGSLSGNGTVTGNVLNAGLVGPGASPGTLNVLGNFTQLADGVLAIDIAGTEQGISYDWLNISGTASLAGTLDVFFNAGYLPFSGSSYTILSYGDWDQSTFDAVRINGLDLAQYSYSTLYSDNGLTLSIAAVPEPSTYALLLAGLGVMAGAARRRNRISQQA